MLVLSPGRQRPRVSEPLASQPQPTLMADAPSSVPRLNRAVLPGSPELTVTASTGGLQASTELGTQSHCGK